MTETLVNLALLGSTEDMADAAQYLEKLPGYEHHAILLYHKARHLTLVHAFIRTVIIIVAIENWWLLGLVVTRWSQST